MSNFICSEYGTTNVVCGSASYKTPKEIEIEELQHQLADASKTIEHLQEQLDIVTEQRNDIHIDKQVLQEQLNEANELIKQINRNPDTDENSVNCCFFYLEKWGVK